MSSSPKSLMYIRIAKYEKYMRCGCYKTVYFFKSFLQYFQNKFRFTRHLPKRQSFFRRKELKEDSLIKFGSEFRIKNFFLKK